jgi:hypothetical protein
VSAATFEKEYAARSGVTVEWLREHGAIVVPCDCDERGCEGWGSVTAGTHCGECGHYGFHHREDGSCHCGCPGLTYERRWPRG